MREKKTYLHSDFTGLEHKIYCPYCGAPNDEMRMICVSCGREQYPKPFPALPSLVFCFLAGAFLVFLGGLISLSGVAGLATASTAADGLIVAVISIFFATVIIWPGVMLIKYGAKNGNEYFNGR